MTPYEVKEFYHAIAYKSPYNPPLGEEEQASLMFLDKDVSSSWKDASEGYEGVSSWRDMDDPSNTPDCCMLAVKEGGILFDSFVKHTSVVVESATVPNALLRKIAKKLGMSYDIPA